jgi:hypothetical protein
MGKFHYYLLFRKQCQCFKIFEIMILLLKIILKTNVLFTCEMLPKLSSINSKQSINISKIDSILKEVMHC